LPVELNASPLLHRFLFLPRTPNPITDFHAFGGIDDDGQAAVVAEQIRFAADGERGYGLGRQGA
jgi:hypothetical protein